MSSRMIQTTDTPTITMGDGTNPTASVAQREEEPAVVSDDDDEDFRSVQRNHNSTSQRNNHITTTTITGTRVRMIGGVHMGKMGILVKHTPKKMAVIVDGEIPTARYLNPSNVEILDQEHDTNRSDSPTEEPPGIPPSVGPTTTPTTTPAAATTSTIPMALQVGGAALVTGGSYRGQYGTIRKETPHRVAVDIVDDTTGTSKTHYLAKQNVQPIVSSSATTAPITHDHQPHVTPIVSETWSSPPLDRSMPLSTTTRDEHACHTASFRGTRPPQVPADVISSTDYLFAANHGANDDPRAVLSSTMSMSSLPLSSRSLSTYHVGILNQDDSSHRSDVRSHERSGIQSVHHTTTTAIEASTTPVVLQVGGTVLVNRGSYCGQYGTIEKVTPHKVAVRIVHDGIGTTHYLSKSHVERHLIEL